MKMTTKSAFLPLIISAIFTSQAYADDNNIRPFLTLSGGYQFAHDSSYHHADPHNGIAGVSTGLLLNPSWRVELGYQHFFPLTAKANNVDIKTELLNLATRYDYEITPDISLYGKLGVAYWNTKKEDNRDHLAVSDNGFSPLSAVGVNYDINEHIKLDMGYQYTYNIGSAKVGNYDSHAVIVGVSYLFGKEKAPVPQAVVTMPSLTNSETSPAAMPPLTRVFFPFDASLITNEAASTLLSIADYLKANPSYEVNIIGNTDNQGRGSYNHALAERRAQSVKYRLLRLGVNAQQITIQNNVDSHPIASNDTSAGREKNRRADITINKTENK